MHMKKYGHSFSPSLPVLEAVGFTRFAECPRADGRQMLSIGNRRIYYILLYCSRLHGNGYLIAPPEAKLSGAGTELALF